MHISGITLIRASVTVVALIAAILFAFLLHSEAAIGAVLLLLGLGGRFIFPDDHGSP
jgi:hypothetical protein